jgi:hypothetical protein
MWVQVDGLVVSFARLGLWDSRVIDTRGLPALHGSLRPGYWLSPLCGLQSLNVYNRSRKEPLP